MDNVYWHTKLLVIAVLLTVSALGHGSSNYVASVIEIGEEFQSFSVADLNGDGAKDLIVSNWLENQGRELRIYWQQAGGKFPAQASRRIDIKRDIVAYALADIRTEPGVELLFFTASSIFSYSATHDSYANNLQKFADWPFINAVPSRRAIYFLGHFTPTVNDSSNSNKIDILVPGSDFFGLISANQSGQGSQALPFQPSPLPKAEREQQLSLNDDNEVNVNLQDGIKIEVGRASNFENLVIERLSIENNNFANDEGEFDRYQELGELLSLQRWISNVQSGQLIAGAPIEFIYIDEVPKQETAPSSKDANNKRKDKNQRVNIVQVDPKGEASIVFQQTINSIDKLQLFDFNNDGLLDILNARTAGADNVNASIYLNRSNINNGTSPFDFSKPDYVTKFTGYDVSFSLSDINGDNTPDLIVGAYQISALNALRDGALVRLSLIYSGNPNFILDQQAKQSTEQTLFNRRPDFKLEENFSAEDIKGLSEAVNFSLDINGDGNKDAIAVDKRGALAARTLNKEFELQDEPHWEFVPLHFVQNINSKSLNSDGRPDFVIRHQKAITVLVSQ